MSVQIGIAQLQLDNKEITCIVDAALEDIPRAREDSAEVDLWSRDRVGIPLSAVPILAHEVFYQVEWFEQVIWFNRTETHDQLYAFTGLDLDIRRALQDLPPGARPQCFADFGPNAGCVISVAREGSFDESLLALLAGYFSTQAGAPGDIGHLIATAYINKRHFEQILERVEVYREHEQLEHEEFSRQARENETEIIRVARELGLNPRPAGIGPTQWYANCAQTRGHPLMITTDNDQFGCGYCRVSGGVDELRAFVAEHRPPEKAEPEIEDTAALDVDMSWRPETYWPDELDEEQLLARISGKVRRDLVRDALARGDIESIDPVLAEETLSEADRCSWGRIHPELMGGEYLPELEEEDVEIARISLRSSLCDQISIRAARAGEKIRYSVCDEYGTEFRLAVTESDRPLTLSELVVLIDGSCTPEEQASGGLLVSYWEQMLEWGHALDECIDFASVSSAWYPGLSRHYAKVADDWCAAHGEEHRQIDDDYEEEGRA